MENIEHVFQERSVPGDGYVEDSTTVQPRESVFFKKGIVSSDGLIIRRSRRSVSRVKSFPRQDFLGMRFHQTSFAPLMDALVAAVGASQFRYVVTPNVDHMMTVTSTEADSPVRAAYEDADFLVCDSRVLSTMAKRSGIELPAVPGSDVTAALLERLPTGLTIAAVGGTEEVHAQLRKLYPQFGWSFFNPPMGVLHSERLQDSICDFVATSDADITFIAIGAPQSEVVCQKIKARGIGRGLALCIGASLEFVTGEKKRAPLWMQKANCEWLFRLASEPHRLAHRYLVKGPGIFLQWSRWAMQRRKLARRDY